MSAMLAAMLAAEFGDDFDDIRDAMADRPGFRSRPMDGVTHIAVHHTAGNRAAPWSLIRDQHQAKGWSGIGYHIGIQGGVVSYLGDVGQARANVANQNHRVIGVVVAGDYSSEPRMAEDRDVFESNVDALQRVVAVLDAFLGRELPVVGHGQVPGGPATACPGAALLAVIPALRQVPAPAPPRVSEAEFALLRRIRDGLTGREVIALNPAAGLQRAIRRAGYVPTTAEWSELDGGLEVVCQGAATVDNNGRVRRRVYFVTKPKWDAIRYVEA